MDNRRIRLLLADDQVLFVESLRRVIQTIDDSIEVIAVAATGVQAVEMAQTLQPDIILLDVRMPEMDGVQAVKQIRKHNPEAKVIMLTTFDNDEYVYEALARGAVGYLLKDIQPDKLVDSIRAVAAGAVLMAESVALKVIGRAAGSGAARMEPEKTGKQAPIPSRPDWYHDLSYREREVAAFLAEGFDNHEIAANMFLAEQTVRNHVSSLYAKLGVRDRIKLVEKLRTHFGNHP